MWEVSGSGPGCQIGYRSVTYEAMKPKILRLLLFKVFVKIDIRHFYSKGTMVAYPNETSV